MRTTETYGHDQESLETPPAVRDRINRVAKGQQVTPKDLANLILDQGLERFERGEVRIQKATNLAAESPEPERKRSERVTLDNDVAERAEAAAAAEGVTLSEYIERRLGALFAGT